jgi:hypothetical protein
MVSDRGLYGPMLTGHIVDTPFLEPSLLAAASLYVEFAEPLVLLIEFSRDGQRIAECGAFEAFLELSLP